jgi:2-polyprenyl-3-methyl-5-hydroxy-6-metoxy-1,4-benzoquinol methylase
MDLRELNYCDSNPASHWYYSSKAKFLLKFLKNTSPQKILDIGSGSAFFSRFLLTNSSAEECWCVDINYDRDLDFREHGKTIHFRRSFEKILGIDLVLLMDVLEHVDDDLTMLTDYVNLMPRGTKFLITGPAFQWLWSDHDLFLEHKRRYSLSQIESLSKRGGYE